MLTGLLLGIAVLVARGLSGEGAVRVGDLQQFGLGADPPVPVGLDGAGPVVGHPAVRRWLLVLFAGAAGSAVGGVALGVGAAGAVLAVPRVLRRRASVRVDDDERRRAGEALLALAAELRAGRSAAEGLATAAGLAGGPAGQALRSAVAAARFGGDVPAALLAPATRPSAVPEVLRGLAACWQVCAQSGSGLAPAVERLADAARARQVQRQAVEAELAGPRATAGLLAALPLAGIGLAAALGADPLHVLLHTPAGLVCLTLGVGLDGLGLWWTGRLVARAVP